jgi:hypothetical protein
MSVFYTIVFEPEKADRWMSYEDNKNFAVSESRQYELLSETTDGRINYYIINDIGEKVYDIWEKAKGDLVDF